MGHARALRTRERTDDVQEDAQALVHRQDRSNPAGGFVRGLGGLEVVVEAGGVGGKDKGVREGGCAVSARCGGVGGRRHDCEERRHVAAAAGAGAVGAHVADGLRLACEGLLCGDELGRVPADGGFHSDVVKALALCGDKGASLYLHAACADGSDQVTGHRAQGRVLSRGYPTTRRISSRGGRRRCQRLLATVHEELSHVPTWTYVCTHESQCKWPRNCETCRHIFPGDSSTKTGGDPVHTRPHNYIDTYLDGR